ncbi:MAG: hypothetical protein AAGG68_15150 [Bacteroidota bacterium]
MKLYFYIAALVIFSVCSQSCTDAGHHHSGPAEYVSHSRANEKHLRAGLKELKAFRTVYKDQWTSAPTAFPYSDYHLVRVFPLDCSDNCFKPEFTQRTNEGLVISEEHFQELLSILENPKSYSNSITELYAPKIGLVLYDAQDVPTEYMSISLEYNSCQSFPGKIQVNKKKQGFSKTARQQLRTLFQEWGIDYYGFSEEWDDEAAYQKYLEVMKEETNEVNYTI